MGAYLRRSNRSRRDDIRRHTQRTKFESHSVGQRVNTSFGHRDVGLEGCCSVVQGGADEDDTATGAGRGGFHWCRQ